MNREELMKKWDFYRWMINKGDTSSQPRDWFESVLDSYEEEIKELRARKVAVTAERDKLRWWIKILINNLNDKEAAPFIDVVAELNALLEKEGVMDNDNYGADNMALDYDEDAFQDMAIKIRTIGGLIQKYR